MKARKLGILLISISVILIFTGTVYFGHNLVDYSFPERICDGICIIIFITGLEFYLKIN